MENSLPDLDQFEKEITALERKIIDHPDKEQLVVFYGSSSLRLWDTLEEDMKPLNALNLGFGGSSFSWCTYYFDRLFSRLQPSHIVIYMGDNDLAIGITPEKVLKKFRMLARMIRSTYPDIPVDFMTIKPSPERNDLLPEIRHTNNLIQRELLEMEQGHLINVFDPMLNEKGVARRELYHVTAPLHMNQEGYRIWKGVLRERFGVPSF